MDRNKELMKLDFYDILEISPNASESQIKKAFRKKAKICHPDKNPDNPNTTQKFVQLKNILEILTDIDSKATYDKLLKGRKEAEIRAKNFSAKTQFLTAQLEKREREAEEAKQKRKDINEREIKRNLINAENNRIIEEHWAKVEKNLKEQVEKSSQPEPVKVEPVNTETIFRVKAKWEKTADWEGFSKEELQRIFYKWGEIVALVMTERGPKGTALIEYEEKSGAEMAVSYEIGPPGKPIKVSHVTQSTKKCKTKHKVLAKKRDAESHYEMNRRREAEREKLMEEIRKSENL